MAIQTKIDITEELSILIEKRLKQEVEKEFDRYIAELNEKKNEIVAGLLLSIQRQISMQTLDDNIIITIKELKN